MRTFSLSEIEVDPATFCPNRYVCIGDTKTDVVLVLAEIIETAQFYGNIIYDELPNIIIEELKDYNLTNEEKEQCTEWVHSLTNKHCNEEGKEGGK